MDSVEPDIGEAPREVADVVHHAEGFRDDHDSAGLRRSVRGLREITGEDGTFGLEGNGFGADARRIGDLPRNIHSRSY